MEPAIHRCGVIGYGGRGHSHAHTLHRYFRERVEIVAVADPVFAVAAPEDLPEGRWFVDYHDLLDLPDVEAVIVATHEVAHVEIALAALAAGKAVLLEKAAAPTWPEAVRLYRHVRAGATPFMLALNLRHFPAATVLRGLLAEGAIGRPVAVTCHVNAGSPWGASCFRRFYHDRTRCGDLVLSKLTHDTDLMQHLLGVRAARVTGYVAKTTFIPKPGAGPDCDHCAITAACTEYLPLVEPRLQARSAALLARGEPPLNVCPFTRPSTSHDTAVFSGLLDGGAAYSIIFTTAGPVYARRYQINGTEGQVSCVLHGPNGPSVVVQRTNGVAIRQEIPDATGGHAGADPRLMTSFLDYLDERPAAPREPEAILTSVMVPLGGLESSETGREVDLSEWYRAAISGTDGRASRSPAQRGAEHGAAAGTQERDKN